MIKNYFSDFFSKKDSERIYEGGLKNQNNSEISQNNFFDTNHVRRNQRKKKGFFLIKLVLYNKRHKSNNHQLLSIKSKIY